MIKVSVLAWWERLLLPEFLAPAAVVLACGAFVLWRNFG
jgi:hypothetical protein